MCMDGPWGNLKLRKWDIHTAWGTVRRISGKEYHITILCAQYSIFPTSKFKCFLEGVVWEELWKYVLQEIAFEEIQI